MADSRNPPDHRLLRFAGLPPLPAVVRVRIEVPRGSFIKRTTTGGIGFVSLLPCPYNYGSIEETEAADGDPLDALVLGPRIPYGTVVVATVRAVMGFVDAGDPDPKIVCSARPLGPQTRRGIERFFAVYATLKRAGHRLRGRSGPTRRLGWLARESIDRSQ